MDQTPKKRILFVDDEAPVLNLLQTLFRHANPECESSFADRGAKALALLQTQSYDVIISDMRMPEMTGAELLEQVRDRYPRTIRVVLSGYADQPMSVRSLASAHQHLAKPFTLTGLQNTLGRIFEATRHVPDPDLQSALGALHVLPSTLPTHARVTRDFASPAATTDAVGSLLARDIAATAKLLQIVHSAFFGAPRPLLTAKDASHALGVNLLRTLTVANQLLIPPPDGAEVGGLPLESLIHHGMNTGLIATRILAQEHAATETIKLAFTAGVLHQVGRLALATVRPKQYAEVMRLATTGEATLLQAEEDAFGIRHPQAGAYLLGLWGLPQQLVELVAHTLQPGPLRGRGFGAVSALHVASYLTRSTNALPDSATPPLDPDYLAALRVGPERIAAWSKIVPTP